MSAGTAVARASARHDPALVAAFLTVVLLAALFLAPRPVPNADPPSLRLAVADLRGHAIVILDTSSPGEVRRIAVPGGPHELVALPDGRLVVSLEQFGALAVVDPASGEAETLHVGGTPHGLAVAGGLLYVTDRSADVIRRFTVGTWYERAPIRAGTMPHVLAAREDGSLAVANAQDDTVTLGDEVRHVSHVPESIAVSAEGVVATAGSVGGTLHLFDAAGAPLGAYELGGRPVRVQYDAAGRVLAAALSADGAVALLERGAVRRVVVGGVPDGLAFSADGRWLIVSDMVGGGVSVVDVQRSRLVQRWTAGQSAGALLVLPGR